MSAGHHTTHKHTDSVMRTLDAHLADPKVKKWLDKGHKVDFSHQMPLTGGSTVEWGTFFLDPILKRQFSVGKKRADLWKFVLIHEVVEKALRMGAAMSYDRAHAFATAAEHRAVTEAGLDWSMYKGVMRRITTRDEHERPKSMPKGYDYGPLRASGGIKALAGLRRTA